MIIKKIMTTTALSTLLIAGVPFAQSSDKLQQDQTTTTTTIISPATTCNNDTQLVHEELLRRGFALRNTGFSLGTLLRPKPLDDQFDNDTPYNDSPHSLFMVLSSDIIDTISPSSYMKTYRETIDQMIKHFEEDLREYTLVVFGTLEALDKWSDSNNKSGINCLFTGEVTNPDEMEQDATKAWRNTKKVAVSRKR